jgi:addiction module RelE/StbE family toxin
MQIVWLPRAVENLEEIRLYIAEERPASAERVAQKIKQAVAMLEDHPQIGKPSLLNGFRELQVAGLPFVIPYKVMGDKLIVVRVFHNKQKPVEWEI